MKLKVEMTIDELVGYKVRKLRRGIIKQEDLAKYMGISHMSLSHLEHGRRTWRVIQLIKVAKFFNKPITYFIK